MFTSVVQYFINHVCQTIKTLIASTTNKHLKESHLHNINRMSTPNIFNELDTYDVPKTVVPMNYDCPKSLYRASTSVAPLLRGETMSIALNSFTNPIQEESYDIPRPHANIAQQQRSMTPSTSSSSLLTCDCTLSSLSNRSSLVNMPEYDVPRRIPLPVRPLHSVAESDVVAQPPPSPNGQHIANSQSQFTNCNCSSYDIPLPSNQSSPTVLSKELPLELYAALDALSRLQAEVTAAITRFLAFVSPNWRLREKFEPIVAEVKQATARLCTAIHDLTEFVEGTLGNATRSEDRTLVLKLKPLVKALRDSDKLMYDAYNTLNAQGWSVELLLRNEDTSSFRSPDCLDKFVACAQTLIEDIRQTTSFIQGNASLLFKRIAPCGTAPVIDNPNLVENYDYVCFESKNVDVRKNTVVRSTLPPNLQQEFETVLRVSDPVEAPSEMQRNELTIKDKLLVKYYAVQITTHMGNLRQAIDSFLETVEKNQPPKLFIAYGKFVVVSAHNLVTIGDIVHRTVSKNEINHKILRCTDGLSEALKACVVKSKKAAARFPSVTAVQEMVDSVVDISQLAFDLKTVMLQAVQLTF